MRLLSLSIKMIGALACAMTLVGAALAQAQYGTPADAKAMLAKAAAAVKADEANDGVSSKAALDALVIRRYRAYSIISGNL